MSEVVSLADRRGELSADVMFERASGHFESALILGWGKDGEMDFRSTSNLVDGGELLWLLEKFKHMLLSGDFEG